MVSIIYVSPTHPFVVGSSAHKNMTRDLGENESERAKNNSNFKSQWRRCTYLSLFRNYALERNENVMTI